MVKKSVITKTIKRLDALSQRTTASPLDVELFSKIALLELCGWVEETVDDIFFTLVVPRLTDVHLKKRMEDKVRYTYGFSYEKNLIGLIIEAYGTIGAQRIEARFHPTTLALFKSKLNSLKTVRDKLAHTHTKGVTRGLVAPSVLLSYVPDIYSGLVELRRLLRLKRI